MASRAVFRDDVYTDCGFPAQDSFDGSGNFVFNQRGSSPFPYYRESIHGTVVTTNLETGGTYVRLRWFPVLRHQRQVRAQGSW